MRIYLSPHLDDAVLSCGGSIHQQVAAGETVWVVTLFAQESAAGANLSPFALQQHAYWGSVPRPMALRRAEDVVALTLLGAEAWHLDYHDAVYRTDARGQWLYTDLATLFGPIHPSDPLANTGVRQIAARIGGLILQEHQDEETVLLAPLGVGAHVDHTLTHLAARELSVAGLRLAFYEDYPYAEQHNATEAALAKAGASTWRLQAVALDASDLSAKASALGYYRSQLAVLFGGAEAMPARVWAFAASRSVETSLAERFWWPQ